MRRALVVVWVVAFGCGEEPVTALPDVPGVDRDAMIDTPGDAPSDSATDGPASDATAAPDTGMPDSGVAMPDTGAMPDAVLPDAGMPDTALPDAGMPDAMPDAIVPDAMPDAIVPDAMPDGGIPACPTGQWCQEPAPVAGKLLAGVWAVRADDVFVVGAGGLILHRGATAWTQMASPSIADLAGVWAAASDDVWAVGTGGTILRYDGATWRAVSAGTTSDLNAVWGSGPDDVWIAGFGKVLHWNGSAFSTQALPGTLYALSGTGPTDVWTTGETAFVDRFTGAWTTAIKPDGNTSTWFAIHAITPTNVFVAGFTPNRETMQWNGTTWTARPCKLGASGCIFQAFFSTSATDLWGVGGSKVGHWNGTAWTAEAPLGATAQLWDVSGAGAHVFVVGSDSVILHRE